MSRVYRFTPDQVLALTLPQAVLYADGYQPPPRMAVLSTHDAERLRGQHQEQRRQWATAWLARADRRPATRRPVDPV